MKRLKLLAALLALTIGLHIGSDLIGAAQIQHAGNFWQPCWR